MHVATTSPTARLTVPASLRWWNMPESDVFLIRLADMDYADLLQRSASSLEIEVKTSDMSIDDKSTRGRSRRVFRSDETPSIRPAQSGCGAPLPGRLQIRHQGLHPDSVFSASAPPTAPRLVNTAYADYSPNLNGMSPGVTVARDFYLISRRKLLPLHLPPRQQNVARARRGGDRLAPERPAPLAASAELPAALQLSARSHNLRHDTGKPGRCRRAMTPPSWAIATRAWVTTRRECRRPQERMPRGARGA
jgi:hypothetical protein